MIGLSEKHLEEYEFYLDRAQLPVGWEVVSLEDVSFVVTDGTHKTPKYQDEGVRFISIKNIRPYEPINWESYEKYISRSEHEELIKRCHPEYDDILFPRIGTLGFAKRIDFDKEVSIFVGLGLVKPVKKYISSKFIEYFLNTPYVNHLSKKRAKGTGRKTLPLEESRRFPIPIPPFPEQQRIVAKIEELFSELDKGIESLKTAREQLNAYRQSVLKYAFEGKLTQKWRVSRSLPSWSETTLGEQLSYVTSGSRGWAKFYADEGDIFIRAQNLKFDRLNLEDTAYVSLPKKSEGMRTLVQQGDLLITITGANVTKTAYLENDIGTAYVSQHVALARPKEGSNTEFLYWFLVAEAAGRSQLKEFAYGAGKPGLNLGNIKSVKINLPDPDEQTEIVNKIDEMLSFEENACSTIDAQLKRIEALRQSILRGAFSGQLVDQDPNDLPASALLELIQLEKEKKSKKKGKKAA
jgi:type I restriction enzyme S subunit